MKLYFSDQDTWIKNTEIKLQPGDMLYAGGEAKHGYRTDYWLILSGEQSESKVYTEGYSCRFAGQTLYVGNNGQEIHLQDVDLLVNHLTLHATE